ncbi:MAG: hypothetical protein CMK07_09555 [Ponticaulis sp.]|nr:hypothetical protein [Ponticaulis sp.]
MSGLNWMIFTASLTASAVGLVLLYLAWKRRSGGWLISAGWLALLVSAVTAVLANGDRGFAQIAVVAMLVISLALGARMVSGTPVLDFAKLRRSRSEQTQQTPITALTVLRDIWTFIITGPIAGLIALFGSAALFRVLRPAEGSPATAGVSVIIAAVVLWGLFSTLLLIESRPVRRSLYALAGMALTGAAAFI